MKNKAKKAVSKAMTERPEEVYTELRNSPKWNVYAIEKITTDS